MKKVSEATQINEIIFSLRSYCIGDILFIKQKPIAAFLLSMSCISVLGALRYNSKAVRGRWERFVKEYMPWYAGVGLYEKCWRNMVVNYRSEKIRLGNNDELKIALFIPKDTEIDLLYINVDMFIDNLINAFDLFEKDLLAEGHVARANAILWDTKNPIFRSRS